MLYKFINEDEIQKYKGGFVVIDNKIHTNPKEETIRKAGFKELVETEMPEYDEEKQYLETKYKDGDVITTEYEVCDIVVPEEE